MVRTYVSGRVVEKTKFPVGDNTRPRSRRRRVSSAAKKNSNDIQAVKRMARTLNCNFSHGDLWLTCKYSEERLGEILEGVDREDPNAVFRAAKRDRDRLIRRVKRELAKTGTELRIVAATSDVDGETGEQIRVHHHLIVGREAREAFLKHWPSDELRIDPLRDQDDYTPIATYILRQCRRQPESKRYTCSRNLEKPIVTEELAVTGRELRAPKGAVIVHRDEYDIERAGVQYIRYIDTRKKKKERRTE